MVGQRELLRLDLSTTEDYYDYIHSSIVNGQREQAVQLIEKMSKDQKKEAYVYIEDRYAHDGHCDDVKALIFEAL